MCVLKARDARGDRVNKLEYDYKKWEPRTVRRFCYRLRRRPPAHGSSGYTYLMTQLRLRVNIIIIEVPILRCNLHGPGRPI